MHFKTNHFSRVGCQMSCLLFINGIVSLILSTINLYINTLKRQSGDVGVHSKAAKLKTENVTSTLQKDGRPSNS